MQSFYQIRKFFQPLHDCKVETVFQNGSKTNPSSNRPKSLLHLISKIFKDLIIEQTSSFLRDNEILSIRPSENHLTNSCLTFSHDGILRSFNKNLMIGMILIDLQKAFVTIDLDVLLKNWALSVSQIILLIDSHQTFSNWLFRVNLENYSDPSNITCVVPQGSIPGPLLFLI